MLCNFQFSLCLGVVISVPNWAKQHTYLFLIQNKVDTSIFESEDVNNSFLSYEAYDRFIVKIHKPLVVKIRLNTQASLQAWR